MALRRKKFTTFNGGSIGGGGGGGGGITIDLPPIGGIDLGPIEFGGGGNGGGIGPPTSFPCAPGFIRIGGGPCVPAGGITGDPIFIPSPGFGPTQPEDCGIFQSPDPITGECRFDIDPGPGTGFPGGGDAAGSGLTRPRATSRRVLECPRFADGKTGILWMNALTGDVICLPRRTSGKGFGLIRKNKPRAKPFISAAEKKLLTKMKSTQNRAKKFAQDAGFTCKKK